MKIFVEAKGIEPLLEEPKSSVLPLDDASMGKSIQVTINYQANVNNPILKKKYIHRDITSICTSFEYSYCSSTLFLLSNILIIHSI